MKVNLFINFYIDQNEERQKELELCVLKNIEHTLIDKIIVYGSTESLARVDNISNSEKIIYFIHNGRPTFNDFFCDTYNYPDDVNIIANTDIYFDETLQLIKDYDWHSNSKTCIALSRWDLLPDGNLKHFNRADSNDTWCFKGIVPQINNANFPLGIFGCDNKILYLLKQEGYNIINPSLTIKTIHVHNSMVRRQRKEDRLPPPYYLINPTTL